MNYDFPKKISSFKFLNFGGTNIYKAKQIETMGRMFCDGTVKAGDHFLFTDAWHPGIISLKYMKNLSSYTQSLFFLLNKQSINNF